LPSRPTERWSLDFLSDVFEPGRRFRIFAVIEDCTRENLALIADTSLSGRRVVPELNALIRLHGKPEVIVSDNGSELTSHPTLRRLSSWSRCRLLRQIHERHGGCQRLADPSCLGH
jgi:putative transposase